MKALFIVLMLISSVGTYASTCDLKANNERLDEINRQFDEGTMRGEDHLVQLTLAHRDRSVLIEACLDKGETEGLSKDDLEATKSDIKSNLQVALEEFRLQIELEIANDHMGMATELMMERDMEKLRVANLIALIDSLIKKVS